MIDIPQEVQDWIHKVFRSCNLQATAKLDRNPFVYEEHLDFSIIESLQQESATVKFPSDWAVQIQAHFLGKTPMHHGLEIADIGLLVIFRSGTKFVRSKVALLQSKRLYPDSVEAESEEDVRNRYADGFGRVFVPGSDFASLLEERVIRFDTTSRYKALRGNSPQRRLIDDYEMNEWIPVYYLLYNPSMVPHSVNVPVSVEHPFFDCLVGVRVVPARNMHSILDAGSPSFANLERLPGSFDGDDFAGWRLEKFVVDLLLQCKAGQVVDAQNGDRLYQAFYRRSRPVATAISVTIDAPDGFEWTVEPDNYPS